VKALRLGLAAFVLALAGWALAAIFGAGEPEAAARAFTSSQQCRDCHAQVYAEWAGSQHARSWNNPAVRALSNDFANTDCIDCHAPRPIFETGIGKRVLPRASRRAEGVDCISCHVLPEGGVAATFDKRSAACRPIAKRELSQADFCAACHDQHQTVEQWKATPFAAQGTDCLDCHMPYRGGDPDAGRDHSCLGGHDLATVRSAVALDGERAGAGWIVAVANVGAGHHFPTDERSRAADLFWRPHDPDAEDAGRWRHLHRFRDPYRHEVDLLPTHLPHGETLRVTIDDPDAAGAIEVALFYKRSPYWSDPERPDPEAEADLVHLRVLEP
jgi:hypothetical protein